GNAVGNSIVSGLSKSPQPSKEDLERQAKLDAMSRQLGQDASKKVNGVLDANLAKTLGKAQETMAVDLNQTVDNFNNFVSSYSAYSSDYELNVAGQLSDYRVTRANNLTASYQAKADALTQRTEYYSPEKVKLRTDASFSAGLSRGMAMHAEGVRNRTPMGVDFTELNAGLKETLQWRDREIANYKGSWVYGVEVAHDLLNDADTDLRFGVAGQLLGGELKAVVGTDFIGGQYKWSYPDVLTNKFPSLNKTPTVTRFSYNWEDGFQVEQLLEKDLLKYTTPTKLYGKLKTPVQFSVAGGVRANLNNQSVRPSVNFGATLGIEDMFATKYSFEVRGPSGKVESVYDWFNHSYNSGGK
ncbi:hypothetical protein, partial [Colwellia sp. MEBiC06753]